MTRFSPLLFTALLAATNVSWAQRAVIDTPDAPAAKGPYSQAVKYGDLLFIAGQIPVDPRTNEWVKGPIEDQTRRVLDNIRALLAANGMSMADVLSTTVYLKDFGDFPRMNAVYAGYFGAEPPARATVPAPLPGDMRVEISAIAGKALAPQATRVKTTYVAFQTLDAAKPLAEAGVMRLPLGAPRPMAAVVIVHGSAGVDSRGSYYAAALNEAGIATLEIDMWTARGVSGAEGRPKSVAETLPDAYAAFKVLAAHPGVDPKRIGIMGFSWGGVVSMLTATRPYSERYLGGEARFAAHAPNYPVCWVYNRVSGYEMKAFTGAPILLQAGEADDYDQPDTCPKLVRSLGDEGTRLVSLKVYADAAHGWDRLEPALLVKDPYSHLGQGGDVRIAPNESVAAQSRAATVAFFRSKLQRGENQ